MSSPSLLADPATLGPASARHDRLADTEPVEIRFQGKVIERLTCLRQLRQLIAAELVGILPQLLQQPAAIGIGEALDGLQVAFPGQAAPKKPR